MVEGCPVCWDRQLRFRLISSRTINAEYKRYAKEMVGGVVKTSDDFIYIVTVHTIQIPADETTHFLLKWLVWMNFTNMRIMGTICSHSTRLFYE